MAAHCTQTLYSGCVKVKTQGDKYHALVKRVGGPSGNHRRNPRGPWEVQIRVSETGDLLRFAGQWGTRGAAIDEAIDVLDDLRLSGGRPVSSTIYEEALATGRLIRNMR
jgi:hypothetical protein